jgi:hypothetical protein
MRTLKLALPLLFSAFIWQPASASPFSDQFNGTTLNPGWIVASPNPSSSVALSGTGQLNMLASYQNGGSDLYYQTNYNAPVILQSVDPSLNWTIQTEVYFSPTNNYQGAGILLATQAGNFTSSSQFFRAAERSYYPEGGGEIVEDGSNDRLADTATTTFLQVQKVGDLYTTSYSNNGTSWTVIGSDVNTTPYDYIGLFTIRQPWDNVALDSNASFEYFNVTSGVPEASTWVMMIFGFCGLGFLAYRKKCTLRLA